MTTRLTTKTTKPFEQHGRGLIVQVAFLDLKRTLSGSNRSEIDSAIRQVLDSGQFVGGEFVELFEAEFGRYCGAPFAAATGNGLDSLYLAARALGIGRGDEVIVPAHTFAASWIGISRTGATLVPVDVREDTGCINEDLIQEAITERTKAVLVVHLYGHIPDMRRIQETTTRFGIAVIEDAAQAHGAMRNGIMAGAWGDASAFSFYPTKNLGALGDAGMVVTKHTDVARKVRRLRDYGRSDRMTFLDEGINSRLDSIQANILRVGLRNLDARNIRRKEIAALYDEAIGSIGDPCVRRLLRQDEDSVWHQYVVRCHDRASFMRHMNASGIGVDIHYPVPPFRQKAFEHLSHRATLWPVAERISESVVSLPIGDYLSDKEVDCVAAALCSYVPSKASFQASSTRSRGNMSA